jgi:uncharacterized membrane protein
MPIPLYPYHPFARLTGIVILWIIQLAIGYLVYRDAEKQKMSAQLWFILVILPIFGYFVAVIYMIVREVRRPAMPGKEPLNALRERFARGEITADEYEKGKELIAKE